MSSNQTVPFLDLVTPHTALADELTAVFNKAIRAAAFIGGPMVQSFEQEFAAFCEAQHCVGVSSGTDALRFVLIASGIQSGDVVVTVPNTFIATTEAITQAGARPAFVDIDEATYNMDPMKLHEYLEDRCAFVTGRLIEKSTGCRVAAVIPVHLYGQVADLDPILEIAERHNLVVIEDACQAHGAEYFSKREGRWRKAGSMGKAAAFSFYPGKNLGACGEAGAVTTDEAELAQKVRMLRDHGQAKKYYHDVEGYNGRLDSIQAGILSIKLRHLTEWNHLRREAATRYLELFSEADAKITLPYEAAWSKGVYHLFVVRVENRDEFIRRLGAAGISTGIHYPIPLHLQNAYKPLGYSEGDFPIAERVCAEIVSLPMFPQLQKEQQSRIVGEVLDFVLATVA